MPVADQVEEEPGRAGVGQNRPAGNDDTALRRLHGHGAAALDDDPDHLLAGDHGAARLLHDLDQGLGQPAGPAHRDGHAQDVVFPGQRHQLVVEAALNVA